MTPAPRVSVIVPTRDRVGSLAVCLAAVGTQTTVPTDVIVVDDGSDDPEAVRAVAEAAGAHAIRHETSRGPAAARNAGANAATGELVLFTDDDCEPAPVWVERLTARLAGGADAAAGPTVNPDPRNRLATASQAIADSLIVPVEGEPSSVRFAPSSNIGCRRETLADVPFDERYPSSAGEDREWCARLRASGRRLEWDPDAIVWHRQELDLPGFWRQHLRYGHAARRFHSDHVDARPDPGFHARLLRDAFRRGPAVGALVVLAQIATAVGYAAARRR
jgi:glycosyltransferase involved in cell wall biosynthesis